jgi:hypothetical protein
MRRPTGSTDAGARQLIRAQNVAKSNNPVQGAPYSTDGTTTGRGPKAAGRHPPTGTRHRPGAYGRQERPSSTSDL